MVILCFIDTAAIETAVNQNEKLNDSLRSGNEKDCNNDTGDSKKGTDK